MSGIVAFLVWSVLISAMVALASWWGHRSYRRFVERSRGPASYARPVGGPPTPVDALIAPQETAHPDQNGLALLLDNADAFAARSLSAQQAGRSLDLMYYIWRTDLTGWLLIDDLVKAADRGVRVRLLLDDVNVQGFDRTFLALAQHPLIDVRLFNPTRNRGHALRRIAEMLLGLARFNRRMHGKMWIVDGRLAVLGGRNIGDTYFGANAGHKRISVDADIMMAGPKVEDVSAVFDGFWNLGLSLPILSLWPRFQSNRTAFRKRLARYAGAAPAEDFRQGAEAGRSFARYVQERLYWTENVELLADPPEKAYDLRHSPWVDTAISSMLATAQKDVQLITPYFVPGAEGLAGLGRLSARGVRVSLVTNALSATDQITVYGAYRTYRGPMLAAGARIHEFSKPAVAGGKKDVIHSKVFLVDGRQGMVGSVNFDLRSAYLNTELGVLFDAPPLIAELSDLFAALSSPALSYDVSLQGDALRWAVARPGLPAVMWVEPEAGRSRRALSWMIGQLPIQRYL